MDLYPSRKCPQQTCKSKRITQQENKQITTIRHARIINNLQKNKTPLEYEIEYPTLTMISTPIEIWR